MDPSCYYYYSLGNIRFEIRLMHLFKQDKPYTAVTVQIERLCKEEYDVEDLSGIVDLIEVVKLQSSGPTEAARAIRKKLKYGDVHKQLRALTILDGLIQNAGTRFQRTFADEPLLERLRVAATDSLSDHEVKQKCAILFRQWAVSYKGTPGLERIASLYKQLPKRKKPVRQEQSKVLKETEPNEADTDQFGHSVTVSAGGGPERSLRSPTSPTTSSSSYGREGPASSYGSMNPFRQKSDKNIKKPKTKPFSLEKEKPAILQTIASSSLASTSLMNAMKRTNRENQRVSENSEAVTGFETCKKLRRQILIYLQHIESGDLLGGLLHANDELVEALMAYEVLDKSLEDDSDSELDSDDESGAGKSRARAASNTQRQMAGLSLGVPAERPRAPKPSFIVMPPAKDEVEEGSEEEEAEAEDEDDPFADRNAVNTPRMEKDGMTWRDV
ncbi:putative actin patch assembly and actin polymerization protein [Trapelia coarctata]|nr:putative actin patch assembly and actin polymerization protein [Trapelia coarctata]